jgi:type IV secretion system protein VirB10
LTFLAGGLAAQDPQAAAPPPAPPTAAGYTLDAGTKVPLSLINSISTKSSLEGDRVYLETAFPVLAKGRIVIPVGSWVAGTVTEVKKPGRAKGRGELYIRFDTLTLPNGVTRDLRSRMDGMDASSTGELDRSEGKVKSEGNKAGDLKTVAETTGAGASVGAIAGSAAGHGMTGLGVGAAAGAVGGLIYVLASRGPDAVIAKGSTLEMVLDRAIVFNESEVDFGRALPPHAPPPASADKGGI